MLTFLIALIVFIIVALQLLTRRFFTSSTLWVGFYFCFFVLSPMLLGQESYFAQKYALIGAFAFLLGYLINTFALKGKQIKLFDEEGKYINKPLSEGIVRSNCIFFFILTFVLIILSIGFAGVGAIVSGSLSTSSLSSSSSGIFSSLFDFSKEFYGYSIVLLCLSKRGKIDSEICVHLLIFLLMTMLFSFTRVSLVYVVVMLLMFMLRKENPAKQLVLVAVAAVLCAIYLSLMISIRTFGIRDGINNFSLSYFVNTLSMNMDFTRIYLSFSDLITNNVKISPIVYTKFLVWPIPRSIWSGKPYGLYIEILKSLDYQSWAAGESTGYTILGEAYSICGKFGFFLYPFCCSLFTTIFDEMYVRKTTQSRDNQLSVFYLIYLAVVFNLQAFRHGIDIATMFLPLYFIVMYIIANFSLLPKSKTRVNITK